MSHDSSSPTGPSSSSEKPKQSGGVAPAPPPPPEVAAQLRTHEGFNPSGKRLATETIVGLGLILSLGVAFVVAGGAIAAWATPLVPIGVDETLGAAAVKQFEVMSSDCDNPAALEYVKTLAAPLVAEANAPFEFTFRVANTEEINAFALPGGYVTVNRGLLEAAETGEEVAGVLAHELQHAIQRHGTRRILRQLGSSALLALMFGGTDLQDLAHLSSRLAGLSYDRDQEAEADAYGLALLKRANIDPTGFGTFFERLSKDEMRPPEFLSTHPDPGRRAEAAKAAKGNTETDSFRKLTPPNTVTCDSVQK